MKKFTLDEWSDLRGGCTGNVFMDQFGTHLLRQWVESGETVLVLGPEAGMTWNAALRDDRLELVQDWEILSAAGYPRP